MKVAADGVANSVGSRMVPAMTRGLNYVASGIEGKADKAHPFQRGWWRNPRLHHGWSGRLVGADARAMFGGTSGTTPDQRTVSGQIGGPLQQGPYRGPSGPGLSAGSAASQQGGFDPASTRIDPAVQAERELARQEAWIEESAASSPRARCMDDSNALTRELSEPRRAGAEGDDERRSDRRRCRSRSPSRALPAWHQRCRRGRRRKMLYHADARCTYLDALRGPCRDGAEGRSAAVQGMMSSDAGQSFRSAGHCSAAARPGIRLKPASFRGVPFFGERTVAARRGPAERGARVPVPRHSLGRGSRQAVAAHPDCRLRLR